jgi:hypothetical protein
MNEAEARTKYFTTESAPNQELIWEQLVRDRWVSDLCKGEVSWEDLIHEADRFVDHQRKLLNTSKPSGRSPRPLTYTVELSDLESEYASAIGLYLAKQAASLPKVRRFRRRTWGGGTLSPEQIVTFLKHASFRKHALKHLEHTEYATITARAEEAYAVFHIGEEDLFKDLVGGWENRSEASQYQFLNDAFREAIEHDSLPQTIAEEDVYLFGVMHLISDGVRKTLKDLARELASDYPWTLRDAAWFVIKGEPPKFTSLQMHADADWCTLNFAPWISERTLRRAYRQLHTSDNRPLSAKSLSLFRFVQEHTEPGQRPEWAKLERLWNDEHSDDFFDRSALRKMYKRAEERLVGSWASRDYLQDIAKPLDL